MKALHLVLCAWTVVGLMACSAQAIPTETELQAAVAGYFNDLFARLEKAAAQSPTEGTFRAIMRPQVATIDGFFGATLINADWEIRQVFFRRDFLAVGFSLKKVKELDGFRALMTEHPAPQLSEPGHGNLLQPRLISMRYPMVKDGKMAGMVSMMVRTEAFLKAVGLDRCRAYAITCRGTVAERKGRLTDTKRQVKVTLPSTEWVIDYD